MNGRACVHEGSHGVKRNRTGDPFAWRFAQPIPCRPATPHHAPGTITMGYRQTGRSWFFHIRCLLIPIGKTYRAPSEGGSTKPYRVQRGLKLSGYDRTCAPDIADAGRLSPRFLRECQPAPAFAGSGETLRGLPESGDGQAKESHVLRSSYGLWHGPLRFPWSISTKLLATQGVRCSVSKRFSFYQVKRCFVGTIMFCSVYAL